MAKMRVYELAKELKLDSKDLVRRLIDMDLDVRNHMSSLSEEEVQLVKEKLAQSRDEIVEEKRVTTRVIRRRRKKVKPAEEQPPAAADEAAAPGEEAEPAEAPAAAEAAETPAEAAPAAEAAEPEAPAEPEPAEPAAQAAPEPEAPAEPAEAPAATPVEEAAPPAEEPGEKALEATEEPAADEPKPQPEPEPEPQAPTQAAPEPEPQAPASEPEPEPQPPAAQKADSAASESAQEKPKAEKKKAEEKPKVKRPKRFKEDQPARIISRPTTPVAPITPSRPPRPGGRPAGRPGGRPGFAGPPPPLPPTDRDRGRARRKKGKKSQQIPDDEYLMRKTSSRRREILNREDLYSDRHMRGRRRGGSGSKKAKKTQITTPKAIKRRIKIGEAITVGELAKRMGIKAAEMVGRLMQMGMMVTLNQSLDMEDASLVAAEFGFEVERTGFAEEGLLERIPDRPEDLKPRPPVVTIMGHVDHGKTSLLDTIRKSDVTSREAGGITQHIGAYHVRLENGGQVVFVDTPGHEAFTAMRARGAKVTDIVVLVVAADDGVMDQTREAINHSRAAEVPIVVAINKIDKPGADPDRVKRELAELELVPEEWGGDTITVEVSAKTGQGVPELLEMLLLQAEVLELKANPDKPARGVVLEARLDKGRGPVATVLIQEGTLKTGDPFVCGINSGRARALFDDNGQRVNSAGPSIPVEVQGFSGVSQAGDDFVVVENEKTAKQIAEHRAQKKREAELSARTKMSLEGFLDQMKESEVKELPLVVKADVQGSVEALVDALSKLGNEEVRVKVIHAATGAITETDVMLAAASEAVIIGFNVRPTGKVSEIAEGEGVEIRTYEVIYKVIEDITAALTGMLAPNLEEEVIGRLEVRQTFRVPKLGMVAGSYVTEGKVERNARARLLRDGKVVANTRIASLRRFKDDVKEVAQGFECGVGLENYNDIKVGDVIEVYVIREVAATL